MSAPSPMSGLTSPPETHRRSISGPPPRGPYLAVASAVVAVLAAASLGMLKLIRGQGVHLTGDEPHYLVAAEALVVCLRNGWVGLGDMNLHPSTLIAFESGRAKSATHHKCSPLPESLGLA